MPSPAPYPSVLSCSGQTLVDANGFTMPQMKGFVVPVFSAAPKPAQDFLDMAAKGARIIRIKVAWDKLQPSGPASSGLDWSGIDRSVYVPNIDTTIQRIYAAGMYAIFTFYYGPGGTSLPAWVTTAPGYSSVGSGSCMANYVSFAQAATTFLANRYGNPSDPQGFWASVTAAEPVPGFRPVLTGMGINEVTPDQHSSADWLSNPSTGLIAQQVGSMAPWCRNSSGGSPAGGGASNWIMSLCCGFGATAPTPNVTAAGESGQTFTGVPLNPFGGLNGSGNYMLELHDYLWCTTLTSQPVFDGRNADGTQNSAQLIKSDGGTYLSYPPVVGGVQVTSSLARQQQQAYVAPYAAYCSAAGVPLYIGESGWAAYDSVQGAVYSGAASHIADKLQSWKPAAPVAITQWDYQTKQIGDPHAARPGTGALGEIDPFGWQVWTDGFLSSGAQVTLTATFSTPGPFTWTCPPGVTSVMVACTGAGGGGGGAATASGSNGGGGGGGEAALEPALAVTPGVIYHGTAGAGGGSNAAGGNTSFTGDGGVVVTGHGGGAGGHAGAAGNGAAGLGGTGSTNTVSAAGGPGDNGTAAVNGGGGGGAAGVSAVLGFPGNAGAGGTAGAASGGTYPGGAGGAGSTSGAGPGGAGSGAGGGGGGALSTGTGRGGGTGGNGQVVITWTMTDPVTLTASTAGGSWAFTAPPGATAVTAQAQGGGAAGFGAVPSGGGTQGGAGGGGGEYAQEAALAITDGVSYALAVGAGGTGSGAAGANSTIAGDAATVTAHGGSAAAGTMAGGAGGTGSTNTVHHGGGAGGAGGGSGAGGGGGGGSGGTAAAGNAGAAGTAAGGGAGGAAVTGGGAGGGGGASGASGAPGQGPGGGGGGGANGPGATGAGADGQVTLTGFVTHPAGPGALALAPLALAGTGNVNASALALAPLALAGTGTVTAVGVTATGFLALAPLALSAAGAAVVPPGTVTSNGALALAPLGIQSPSRQVTFPGQQLPVKVEILVNNVWADITSYVYVRDGIVISARGRPDEASSAQPAQVTLTLNNADASFSPASAVSQFYPYLVRNTQLRISVVGAVTSKGAWYSGIRFWGEVPAWPPQWNLAGTDAYVPITACGVLQRMRQSKFSASPLARYYANLVTSALAAGQGTTPNSLVPAGYWPCEDGTGAASFSSGIPGGSPMTWSGGTGGPNGGPGPGLAADSNAPGSAPFAQLDGSSWTGAPGAFTAGGQTWGTPGTYQWLCPAGITTIKAECWGAGGGGSSGNNTSGNGGGGGEYAAEAKLAVTPGKTYTLAVGAGGSGGAGTFATSPLSGTAGAATTFTGDSVTVTAHGGKGGTSSGGSGGSGSANTAHFPGGRGASTGSGFGGGGGGSSAGNAAAGNNGGANNGTIGGKGGAARPGGGPGGDGGAGATAAQGNAGTPGSMPVPGPGGGGGAGGFNGGDNYSKPGGGGQSGQVAVSFSSAPTGGPAPYANVLRFVLDVPAAGGVDGAIMCQALTSGTVADFHVKYHTGGNLELRGNNGAGTQLFSSGSKSFGANGQVLLVSAELTQAKPGTITWTLTAITPAASSALTVAATYTGTVPGTLGSVTAIKTNSVAPFETGATGVGHISIQYAVDPVLNLAPAFAAYSGELAAARFLRLCAEQRVPVTLTGNVADTPQMGPQPAGLLVDLLQDCEDADLGQMFERRDAFGLGYRTRLSLHGQSPAVVLDLAASQLTPPLNPTNDDQLTRNDIVATRAAGGTTYEAVLSSGAMSVQDPPNGVGLYSYPVTVNLLTDAQLAAFAGWLLTLGTLDEFRYPVITVDMRRLADVTFTSMAQLDIGGFLQVVNSAPTVAAYPAAYPPAYTTGRAPQPWLPPLPVNQLASGFTETINVFEWTIAVNAVPEDPYAGTAPTW